MTVKHLFTNKLAVFVLGLTLGGGCMIGIGAAKSQQIENTQAGLHLKETPEFGVICLGDVSYAAVAVERADKTVAMGFSVMLSPFGTPVPCTEK